MDPRTPTPRKICLRPRSAPRRKRRRRTTRRSRTFVRRRARRSGHGNRQLLRRRMLKRFALPGPFAAHASGRTSAPHASGRNGTDHGIGRKHIVLGRRRAHSSLGDTLFGRAHHGGRRLCLSTDFHEPVGRRDAFERGDGILRTEPAERAGRCIDRTPIRIGQQFDQSRRCRLVIDIAERRCCIAAVESRSASPGTSPR